ncbi:MAG: ABC transporter permease subunit [Bacillota bacterium]
MKLLRAVMKDINKGIVFFLIFIYIAALICYLPDGGYYGTAGAVIEGAHIRACKKVINILQLDFGKDRSLGDIKLFIMSKFKYSVGLLSAGVFLGIILGIAKGIFDSSKKSEKKPWIKVLLTLIPMSFPEALVITVLQIAAIWLINRGITVFKVAGTGALNHVLLPSIALSILPACYIARVTTMSIESFYKQDFIMMAAAKGCSNIRILYNHVMRNSMYIIAESFKEIIPLIVSNLVIVEYLFNYRGLATQLMQALQKSNENIMIASIIAIGIIYALLNILLYIMKAAAGMKRGELA